MSVQQMSPLPVLIPLLTAAAIVISSGAPRRVHDVMATAAAAATTVLCAVLLVHARHAPLVEWLGGWRPHHDVALGIALVVDQLGAGAAVLASGLLTAALVYSWVYFEELDGLVHALMLVLAAAMVGFCLTGDLFTMIVFFVLMTVSSVALTAVENEHRGPLQGAINFAVVNSIAGFAALMAATLVYGRTGALNLAQIGLSLSRHPIDALVAVGFALIALAFLTKAAAAPFHFWMPDASAVAPTPVCALLSGATVWIALLGVARLLSTAFAHPLEAHRAELRTTLLVVGAVTALGAAVACFQQRHVKRLLAFAAVSQVGVVLCGIALLRHVGLAGAVLSALGAGVSLAALFGAAGVLLRHYGTTDEFALIGRGRELPLTATVFVLGGLVLAGMPPGAVFFGHWLIGDSARAVGHGWVAFVIALSSALTGAAVLRVAGRVVAGWGVRESAPGPDASEERSQAADPSEEGDLPTDTRPSMVLAVVPLGLLALAALVCLVPGFVPAVVSAAAHFRDVGAYTALVLGDSAPHYAPVADLHVSAGGWIFNAVSVLAAVLAAWAGLRGRRVAPTALTNALRAAHSGHVGDYVAWWTFGMATIGGALLWAITG